MNITKERLLRDAVDYSHKRSGKQPTEVGEILTVAFGDGEITGFLLSLGATAYWDRWCVEQEDEERKSRRPDPGPAPTPPPFTPPRQRLNYYQALMLTRVGNKRLRDCTRDDLFAWAVSLDRIAVHANVQAAWARRLATNMKASQLVGDLDPSFVEGLVRCDFAEAAE